MVYLFSVTWLYFRNTTYITTRYSAKIYVFDIVLQNMYIGCQLPPLCDSDEYPQLIFSNRNKKDIWAAPWESVSLHMRTEKDLDRPVHPRSLIRAFTVCFQNHWLL